MIHYLSEENLIEINREATLRAGNPFVVSNPASLGHVVSAVQYKYRGKPDDESIWLKAAFLLDFLANRGHIFADGNKRTAITATAMFLGRNGFVFDARNEEVPSFVLSVARGGRSLGEIARWLKERVKTSQGEK